MYTVKHGFAVHKEGSRRQFAEVFVRIHPAALLTHCSCCTLHPLHEPQESIKASQGWFMACAAYAPGLAYMMASRAVALQDFDKLLHLVYLANDILFKAMQQQQGVIKQEDGQQQQQQLDPAVAAGIATAFLPAAGVILAAGYAAAQVGCDGGSYCSEYDKVQC